MKNSANARHAALREAIREMNSSYNLANHVTADPDSTHTVELKKESAKLIYNFTEWKD